MDYNEISDFDFDADYMSEPENPYTYNRERELALKIVTQTGANLFLTGKAGTGKTTFLRDIRNMDGKRMVVLAPTGVAAINAGGMTMHSFFMLPFSPYIPGKGFIGEDIRKFKFSKQKKKIIDSLDLLVIDEISMVRPDTLDAIDDLLRRMRGIQRPFGGIQLLLIGDLRQLPPVIRDADKEIFEQYYPSPYFFESHALKEAGFLTVELQTIYRQQDREFIAILNAIREGKGDAEILKKLNSYYRPEAPGEEDDRAIRLSSHNSSADRINEARLAMLPGNNRRYDAVVKGTFPDNSFPADKTLYLKTGARVMFIKNDSGTDRRFYNGMLGTVAGFGDEDKTVIVTPDDHPDRSIEIGYLDWENTAYGTDPVTGEIIQDVVGTFSQVPLRAAWAITIHKSQGLTFDRAMIDAQHAFSPGQLYVALSRCRSLAGMRLLSPISARAVMVDSNVDSFIDQSRANRPDDAQIDYLKDEYCRTLLCEMFNFTPMRLALEAFSRCVLEYVAPIPGNNHLFNTYTELDKGVADRMVGVGTRFNQTYASCRFDSATVLQSEQFKTKVASGCAYFLEEIKKMVDILKSTPRQLDNAEYTKRLNRLAEELNFHIFVKRHILQGVLADGFNTNTYMKHKAIAVMRFDDAEAMGRRAMGGRLAGAKAKGGAGAANGGAQHGDSYTAGGDNSGSNNGGSARKGNKAPKESKPKKPKGYSQMETLRLFKSGRSIEQISEERGLAVSTIAGHLGEMAAAGRIALEELIPADTLGKIETHLGTRKSQKNPADMADSTIFRILTDELSIPATLAGIYSRATRTTPQ